MHELSRPHQEFVNALYDVIVCLNVNLESFKVDIGVELGHVFVQLVNNVVHEGKYVVLIPFQARQVSTIIIQFLELFINLNNDIVHSPFLKH